MFPLKHCVTRVLHLVWSPATELASFLSSPISFRSSFVVSCRVFFGLPTLIFPPSAPILQSLTRHVQVASSLCCHCDASRPVFFISFLLVTRNSHQILKIMLHNLARWCLFWLAVTTNGPFLQHSIKTQKEPKVYYNKCDRRKKFNCKITVNFTDDAIICF